MEGEWEGLYRHVTSCDVLTCLPQDIAVLTNNVDRCLYYEQNSQNVQSRYFCDLPLGYINENMNPPRNRPQPIPINQTLCEVGLGLGLGARHMCRLGFQVWVGVDVVSHTCAGNHVAP